MAKSVKKNTVEVKKSKVRKTAVKNEEKEVKNKPQRSPKNIKVADNPEESAPINPEKQDIISKFQVNDNDTGSPEVQVALLSKRIEKLVTHLKTNPSDNHSRRGLLGIVSKRRRLLNYLEKKDNKRFKVVSSKIGLGK